MTAVLNTEKQVCVSFCCYCCLILYLSLFQIQAVNGQSGLSSSTSSFCIDIPGPLSPGKIIKITGVIGSSAKWMNIDLRTACMAGERPLHIGIRFYNQTVISNSFEKGTWGTEEIASQFPFELRRDFVLSIEVRSKDYKIEVNGVLWTFTHKLPYSAVSNLDMSGGPAKIRKVEFTDEANKNQPDETQIIYPVPLLMSKPVDYPTTPFWGRFPNGLRVGDAVLVQGVFPTELSRASINFCASDCSVGPVLLHLDIRSEYTHYTHNIVRAFYRDGSWRGIEENINGAFFPFHIREPFAVLIEVQSDSYSIEINNQHCCTDRHRLPVSEMRTMSIEMGPVDIWKVKVCQPASDASCTSVAPKPSDASCTSVVPKHSVAPETSMAQRTSGKSSSNDPSTCRTRIYVIILLFLAYLFG